MNILLLNFLESVLGSSKHTSGDNYTFKCIDPDCQSNKKHKKKLEISLETKNNKNAYHCWSCGLKGTNLFSLLRQKDVDYSKLEELKLYINLPTEKNQPRKKEILKLPKEFIFLGDYQTKDLSKSTIQKLNLSVEYLKSRNISKKQIYTYNIGYCVEGYYQGRVIIPSYDIDNNLINYTARLIEDKENSYTYLKPRDIDENIINFENLIDFSKPIYLCEGSFDAIAIGDNVIPLFGKRISNKLLEKLYQPGVDNIYICLDKDAFSVSIKHAKKLMDMYKKVYFVEIQDKDPSKMGHGAIRELINNTPPMDLLQYVKLKNKYQ